MCEHCSVVNTWGFPLDDEEDWERVSSNISTDTEDLWDIDKPTAQTRVEPETQDNVTNQSKRFVLFLDTPPDFGPVNLPEALRLDGSLAKGVVLVVAGALQSGAAVVDSDTGEPVNPS